MSNKRAYLYVVGGSGNESDTKVSDYITEHDYSILFGETINDYKPPPDSTTRIDRAVDDMLGLTSTSQRKSIMSIVSSFFRLIGDNYFHRTWAIPCVCCFVGVLGLTSASALKQSSLDHQTELDGFNSITVSTSRLLAQHIDTASSLYALDIRPGPH